MKNFTFPLVLTLSLIMFSCNRDENISLTGSKWEAVDKTIIIEFQTESACTIKFFIDSTTPIFFQSVEYTYSYENQNITLLTPSSKGFGCYIGTIEGKNMKIKLRDSSFDYIELKKIK